MARAKPEKIGKTAKRRARKAGTVSTSYRRGGTGVRWRLATDLAPSLDAVALVDHVSDVVMAEHWHAIGEGRRAEGPELQPKLAAFGEQGKRAAAGKRPDVRGFTGLTQTPFRDSIARSPIKVRAKNVSRSRVQRQRFGDAGFIVNETVEGTKASCTIRPDKLHESFLALELKRGNTFFFVNGYVAEAVDKALAAWVGAGLDGVLQKADKRERKAGRARTK